MAFSPEYVVARGVLLDALGALGEQRRCVVLVGAQAVYLRAREAGLAVALHTLDGDLGIRPELLANEPELASCMKAAGFDADTSDSVGIWSIPRVIGGVRTKVKVDLLVPNAVGGEGRRSAQIPPHERRTARKVRGLEGALFDHNPMTIAAMDPADTRSFEIAVAGPGALLVAKAHKIQERLADGRDIRRVAKDALDVVRLLRGCTEEDSAARLRQLLAGASSADRVRRETAEISRVGVEFLRMEFGVPAGRGCDLAVTAAAGSMEEDELRASTVELTRRLLRRLDTSAAS
jgi:hypothetical protein